MRSHGSTRRRDGLEVLGRAAVVGAIASVPVACLSLLTIPVSDALGAGAGLGEALSGASPTPEDWEILPAYLLGAVLVGAMVGFAGAGVWLWVMARARRAPWLAHVVAVAFVAGAAALPGVVLPESPRLLFAVWSAVLAGLVVPLAATRVANERSTAGGGGVTSLHPRPERS